MTTPRDTQTMAEYLEAVAADLRDYFTGEDFTVVVVGAVDRTQGNQIRLELGPVVEPSRPDYGEVRVHALMLWRGPQASSRFAELCAWMRGVDADGASVARVQMFGPRESEPVDYDPATGLASYMVAWTVRYGYEERARAPGPEIPLRRIVIGRPGTTPLEVTA